MSLRELYRKLAEKPSGHEYTASKIEGWNNVYLATNLMLHPVLIVETSDFSVRAPLRAARVSFRPNQELNVSVGHSPSRKGRFHILICESSEQSDIGNFLILIEAFVASHYGSEITEDEMASFFRSMIRLFAIKPASDLDSRRQGLWGELFIMQKINGFLFWAPSWHGSVTGLFDFSSHRRHVEVKTTLSSQRIHHFSHRQIWEAEGEQILIASLMLQKDVSGLSLRDLINRCRAALRGTPDYLKLEFAIRYAGMNDEQISGPQFDAAKADRDLSWFKATDAPHFRVPEPEGVSETSYKVDLTKATPLSPEELKNWLVSWASSITKIEVAA